MDWGDGGHGENCGCSTCGYAGENGEALAAGDGCPLCGEGTMLSGDDFMDKFGMSIDEVR